MFAMRRRLFVLTVSSGLLASVVFFFGFHILAGDRGFLARPELDRKIVLAEEKLTLLQKHHAFLSHRIHLLQADSWMQICWLRQPGPNSGSTRRTMS